MKGRPATYSLQAPVQSPFQSARILPTSGMFPEALDAIPAYREHTPANIFVIPVRLSKCKIPPFDIDDTETLDDLEYVNLFPAAKRDTGLQRLIQSLQATPHHP